MLTSAEYNPELSFSTLLISHYNKLCYKKLMDICTYPKHHFGEVFLLSGEKGSGKTHLLRAFQNEFKLKHNKLKCGYLDCKKEFYGLDWYQFGSADVFHNCFVNYDVLILDNIDIFFDSCVFKDTTIDILRNLSKNKVIILSSVFVADKFHFTFPYARKFVKQIGVYKRLDFNKISLQEKLQIALKNNECFKNPLPDNIIYFAASSFGDNISRLKQMLSLALVARYVNKEFSSEDLKKVCDGLINSDDCFCERTFFNLLSVNKDSKEKIKKEVSNNSDNLRNIGCWRPSFLLLKPSRYPFSVLEDVHLTPKKHEKEAEDIYAKTRDCYFSKKWGIYQENGPAIMVEIADSEKFIDLQSPETKKIRSDIEKVLKRPIRISKKGIEIPYRKRYFVRLRDVADNKWLSNFKCDSAKIPLCLGIDSVYGQPWFDDLADIGYMSLVGDDPHTMFLSLITTFLLFKSPDELRMINMGKNFVCLYEGLPHLIDLNKKDKGLREICEWYFEEIEKRKEFLKTKGFKNFSKYKSFYQGTNFISKEKTLPYVLVFGEEIDDYTDYLASSLLKAVKEGKKVGIFSIFTFKSTLSGMAANFLYDESMPVFAFRMGYEDSMSLLKNDDATRLLPYGDFMFCDKEQNRGHCVLVTEKEFLKVKEAWILKVRG